VICYVFKKRRRIAGKVRESRDYFGKLRMEWETGQPRVFALHTSDRREAERRLLEERDKGEKRHRGILPPEEQENAAEMALVELLDIFLAEMSAKGRSARTVRKYADLRLLFSRLQWQRLKQVNARQFAQWLAHCGLSAKTRNDYRANASRFVHWLQFRGMLGENPLARIEPVIREARQFRRSLDESERARLLKVSPQKRADVYLVLWETGLRRSEFEALTAGDVFLETPAPFVRVPGRIDKNNGEWDIPLRPHVVAAIRRLIPEEAQPFEFVFRRLVPRVRVFKKDLAAAGIPFIDASGRRVDLHALRVTLGTDLCAAGVAPRVVMQLMRHRNIATTMKIYTDANRLPLAAAVALLPKISTVENSLGVSTQKDTQIVRSDGQDDASAGAAIHTSGNLQSASR
jgi:integrase